MPFLRSEWHERIKAVDNEYHAVRVGVDRLLATIAADPTFLGTVPTAATLRDADRNLEGTYLVRLFAEFESALRSYDRARHNNPALKKDASVLIDQVGGRRGQGIPDGVRQAAHNVRRVRNYWAMSETLRPRS